MTTVSKALIGILAAGALALGSASPAMARDRDNRYDRGGISAGEVLAGVLVIGGIAAVAAASNNRERGDYRYNDPRYNDGRYDNGRYGDNRYDQRDYQQNAVALCVQAAEYSASRNRYGGEARVTQIRKVDRDRNGFEVKGRIAVQQGGRDYRRNNWDEGSFSCEVRGNRVSDLDFGGIRGL